MFKTPRLRSGLKRGILNKTTKNYAADFMANEEQCDKNISGVVVAAVIPYFLDKGLVWFHENKEKISDAARTQPFFQDNVLFLKKGQKQNLSELLRKLDEMGYEKVFSVGEPGEFSQRGGLIDIFPVNENRAFRLDFLGNEIESIFALDIALIDEKKSREIIKKRLKSQKIFSDLKDIKPGDYLVHLDHGVGRFAGFTELETNSPESKTIFPAGFPARRLTHSREWVSDGQMEFRRLSDEFNSFDKLRAKIEAPNEALIARTAPSRYYIIEYDKEDKLLVPVELERKLSRYVGFADPAIARLGSSFWQKTKKKIKEEAEKTAKELLRIYAGKEAASRKPYEIDRGMEEILESGFKYEETPDQIKAIEDIKNDMAKEKPMDRIVCGDTGFGKTEIAIRTALIAASNGRQTAIICPTTILASQHFNNFKERFKNLPVKVALLSRMQNKIEQNKILREIKNGKLDIVIGTHRLLSKDIEFKNLCLLIIDDEQRFGVKQKEKLREKNPSLDILSLSATPIPRTIYLALSSFKGISLIHTPPRDRWAIKTKIAPYNIDKIKEAICFELKRGGQVYFLHNRVSTIRKTAEKLRQILPEAKFAALHGRLEEKEILEAMKNFSKGKTNILVATTIIENGIDLPNVNTIIIEDGSRLGLAQAHQIRGRVGRSFNEGFAYIFYPKKLSSDAKNRLNALKEMSKPGDGYRIALKDMELRGAGNILGKEQSGAVNKVGLNLYCQMLSEAVERLKS